MIFDDVNRDAQDVRSNWRDCFPEIVGRSDPMMRALEMVSKVARSDSAVLIHGESGTGKELIAGALHRLSSRASKSFVAINCSAIPENLLESELFGHEKGAFTGASGRHTGHFERADGGTLFLDEIGDMPARLQAKLLRILQEKQYIPVGGTQLKSADVRIVAATNVDLEKAVQEGRFRLDLYYRLNVFPIEMPPLRERRGDVPELLQHFLDMANRTHQLAQPAYFSGSVLEILNAYSWPGNVRELQNLVERVVVLTNGGEVTPEALPAECRSQKLRHSRGASASAGATSASADRLSAAVPMVGETHVFEGSGATLDVSRVRYPKDRLELPHDGMSLQQHLEEIENDLITQALSRTQNNKNQAAKLLGLNRTTLVEKIKKRRIGVGSK